MVKLNLDAEDCKNAAEMIESMFPEYLKTLLEINELDNIHYLGCLERIFNELDAAGRGEREIAE